MADELQPLDGPITAGQTTTTPTPTPPPPPTATTTTTTNSTTTATITAPPSSDNTGLPLAPKRQRRPSVRLGEIGDQPAATVSYESQLRRARHHPWRYPKDRDFSSKAVKARSITNLVNGGGDSHENQEAEERNQNGEGSNLELGNRNVKAKRGTVTKRVRSNWISNSNSKLDDGGAEGDSREDVDEGFRDFDPDSDSPLKDPSPVHSVDNAAVDLWNGHRRSGSRARVLESRENDAVELDNIMLDYNCSGVRSWLIDLGLSRYAPVFEIHEVDDDVLPMLTLEDLKDMGINAVGSRRKMYTAIQKLRKGFS
ncbi:uncharacterized protein LOC107435228 [Ziziphus jujuba]|nr:uncharacterized protein LOC107435228 [Ziziphus jujuba]